MDQDTTGKSGSRSWRDRLGIDEQKPSGSDSTTARTEPASKPSAPAQAKPAAPQVQAKVVANPAPMAPRPGTAAKAPPAPKPAPAPAPQRAAQDDAFAERLRKHREAAEEAVKKRSGSASLEKFSFARKEVEVAKAEKAQPAPAPAPTPVAPAQPAAAAPRPSAPVPPAPAAPPVPAPRPVAAPAAAPRQAGVPAQRPGPQAPQPSQPAYRPQQPGYPGAQQPPAYRPPGPGYAPPPGPAPAPPRGYAPTRQPGYGAPAAPAAPAPRPPAPPAQAYQRAPHGDDDLFQDNGYRPAAPLGRSTSEPTPAKPGNDLRAGFDDPFDDTLAGGYGGRTARDYSQAYREFDDDYEDDEPRRGWGGIIMLILALLFIGALAVGGVLWWQSQTNTAGGTSGGQVPEVAAPDQPAKAEPDATQPAQTGTQPQGRKLIYERILSDDGANQPEQIIPREEQPVTPAPSGNTDGDSLPLPLPPPPQNSGSLQPGAAEPAAQQVASADTSDNQEGAAGVEPAASAVSSGPISQPPVPRRKPRNLVASVQNAPTTQFQPVLQPAPQPAPQPQPLPQIAQPTLPQQGAVIQQPQLQPQPQETAPTRSRVAGRDEDPLAGTRRPFNSSAATQQQSQSGPIQLAPAPAPAEQQVALAPPPTPAPAPAPQQPVTSQDLQAFAPPSTPQSPPSSSGGTGYVIQLAAYRSEQEAMAQYQQLKSRHGNLLGNLPPSVQQTNLGASGTFYRLGMGPMSSKQAATDLCNKLIAAGERDCLVRRR